MARRRRGIWRKEKENGNASKRRWWDMGAMINEQGNLEIIRVAEDGYLRAIENKCITFRQADTLTNPEAVEIINEGTGMALAVRTGYEADGDTDPGGFDADGDVIAPSSESLKTGFKNMGDSVVEKQIAALTPKSFAMIKTGKKSFGLTAENFNEVTGLGTGNTISALTVAGLAIRYIQLLDKKIKKLESMIGQPTE